MDRLRNGSLGLGAALVAIVALLAAAPAASAVQSAQYDAFTACPVDDPALNDPAAEVAVCTASAGRGELKIGDRIIQLQRVGVQFAAIGLAAGDSDCPVKGNCFGRVPGSTTIEDVPSLVGVGAPGSGQSNPGEGNGLHVRLTVEAAGDVRAFLLVRLLGIRLALYKLPVKVHVEAPWLGDDCYIGSNQRPVVIEPFITAPPTKGKFLQDPNGFAIEEIFVSGLSWADQALAIPRAHNCGHGESLSDARANALVNDRLGLPSAAGLNAITISDADLGLVGAEFDGIAPDGGAELKAAFEAAK